jgi:hypothetical protein
MRYNIRVNKRIRDVRVYKVLKKTEGNANLLTKLFIKVFAGRKKEGV